MRSVIFAPGMQPATRSMSCSKVQAVSAEAGIAKHFSSWTFIGSLDERGPASWPCDLTSTLVDPQRIALLPHPVGAVRHVHVRDTQVCEGIDHCIADAGDAADVRRLGHALGADRVMRTRC